MINYKEITSEQIDRMNLNELNQYIASYGKVLLQRTQRILEAAESTERTRALTYNQNALSHITKSLGIDNIPRISEDIEYKDFSSLVEARARLKNLVASLRSTSSTITGQKELAAHRRQGIRERLNKMGITKNYSAKELDIIGYVFQALEDDNIPSDEVIDGYYLATEEGIYDIDEIAEWIRNAGATGAWD